MGNTFSRLRGRLLGVAAAGLLAFALMFGGGG